MAICTVCIAACKKDANGVSTGGNTKNLTTGIWTLQKRQFKQPDGSWKDDPDPQDLGHFSIAFNPDHTTSVNEDGLTIAGTWEVTSDFSQLTGMHSGESFSSTDQVAVKQLKHNGAFRVLTVQ
jgi:hypothetical protein